LRSPEGGGGGDRMATKPKKSFTSKLPHLGNKSKQQRTFAFFLRSGQIFISAWSWTDEPTQLAGKTYRIKLDDE
jgi:hypothetical protein